MDDTSKAAKLKELRSMLESVPADVKLGADAATHDDARGRRGEKTDLSHRRTPDNSAISADGLAADDSEKDEAGKDAWKRVLALCSHNEFCRMKMIERLKREEFPPKEIEEAVDKAVRIGLIDDIRWGEMRIAGLMHKGEGMQGVERELRQYGIEPSDVPGWPAEYSERFGSEIERAQKVLAAKPIRSKNPRASAYARLVRKGYSPSIASEAAGML